MPLLRQFLAKAAVQTSPRKKAPTAVGRPEDLQLSSEREVVVWLLKRFTPAVAVCVEDNSDAAQALLEALSCPCVVGDNQETVQMLAVARVILIFFYFLIFRIP